MTEQNIKHHENATQCWICEQEISDNKNNLKVNDHCHFTGKYRGAAHKYCNLKLKVKPGKTNIALPYSGLKWLTKNDKKKGKFNRETRKGWILEVDLGCPKELHKFHLPRETCSKKRMALRIPN